MEFISWNPRVIIRRYREWRLRQEEKCTVRISCPRMKIRGKLKSLKREPAFKYVAFLGIPYALPPVGSQRFEPPQPLPQVPPVQRTPLLRAYHRPNPCAQHTCGEFRGSEDCLYLNVYTPMKPENISQLLPVLVYIHGGGFEMGEGADADPENMIKENLVVITINYRLDVFGFLNMRAINCRGNAGLKDQVMALRWIRSNIEQFKGNPHNITICGQSAGGSCVNFHMISPLSKGLFHRAIVMAGGVYCPWGYGGHAKEMKQLFKKEMKMENVLRHVVVETLKRENPKDLFSFANKVGSKRLLLEPLKMTVFMRPSVEYIREDAFLPDSVEKLMAVVRPVPTIAGITREEGYMFLRVNVDYDLIQLVKDTNEFNEFLKQNLQWPDPPVGNHYSKIKAMYFPNESTMSDEEITHNLATLITDLYFWRFYDNFKIGNLMNDAEWPPFYVYEFSYFTGKPICSGAFSPNRKLVIYPRASEHSDDYIFLFKPRYLDCLMYYFAGEDRKEVKIEIERVQKNMSNLWGSFCRTGIPKSCQEGDRDVNWLHHTEEVPRYLEIGHGLTLRDGRLNEERWSALTAICQSEATAPSLATTPLTPEKVTLPFKSMYLDELGPSATSDPNEPVSPTVPSLATTPQTLEKVTKPFKSTYLDELGPSATSDPNESVSPTVPSLATTPQTPEKVIKPFTSTYLDELGPSATSDPNESVSPTVPSLATTPRTPEKVTKPFTSTYLDELGPSATSDPNESVSPTVPSLATTPLTPEKVTKPFKSTLYLDEPGPSSTSDLNEPASSSRLV